MRRAWIVLVALQFGGAVSAAQPVWGEIELLGGAGAARRVIELGDETRADEHFLLDYARRYHGTSTAAGEHGIELLERYLTHLGELDTALRAWPNGFLLTGSAMSGQERDRWRDVLELVGLRLREVKNRWVVEARNDDDADRVASWAQAVGIDRGRVATELNAGRRVTMTVPRSALPLPIPTAWPQILRGNEKVPPVIRLTTSRAASLLYVGLTAMDEGTLQFFAARPDFLRRLSEDDAAVLAAFGRSLHVSAAAVDVPGGRADLPMWEELVGRAAGDPERFVREWLSRDEGRLAYFYDTAAYLDPLRRAWLLSSGADARSREDNVRRVYQQFASVEPTWRLQVRPFYRPEDDPAVFVALLDISADGSIGPPWWPPVLERIVETEWPERAAERLKETPANAAWTLKWMFDKPADSGRRFRLLRFAQRRFRQTNRGSAAALEVALRGFYWMPGLQLSLERMGVRTPEVFAAQAESARRITMSGGAEEVIPLLRQTQGGLALLEQMTRHRVLTEATIEALVQKLAQRIPQRLSRPAGAVAAWLFEDLLPAVSRPNAATSESEELMLLALLAPHTVPDRPVAWEGLTYRIDPVGPVVRDALAVRTAAGGPTLADLATLHRVRRDLEGKTVTLETVTASTERLRAVQGALKDIKDAQGDDIPEFRELQDVLRAFGRLRRPGDAARAARELPQILAAVDALTGRVVPAMAYALAVAPTPQPAVFVEIAGRHTFAEAVPADAWRETAWQPATTDKRKEGGLFVLGSMFAIDVALVESQLRPLSVMQSSSPLGATLFNTTDHAAYLSRLVLAHRTDDGEGPTASVVNAVQTARKRLDTFNAEDPAAAGDVRARLRAAGVGASRINFLMWSKRRGAAAPVSRRLTPTELFHFGSDAPLPVAWGVPAMPFDGCVCLRAPERRGLEDWSGHGASGYFATSVSDLQIRLSELLQQMRLPGTLTEPLLPFAAPDILNRIAQVSPDDWESLMVSDHLTSDRVEEYLLALIAQGVLAAPRTPGIEPSSK